MQNFWEKKGWENEDPQLLKLKSMPFERPFPFIPETPGLYLIRGPRQVGKSSWLKTILSQKLKKKSKCFYASGENIPSHQDLTAIFEANAKCDFILIDEISFISEWHRSVKHFVDQYEQKVLVITGSHAHDLKKGADQLPGRYGNGGDFELLPMGFFEFKEMAESAGVKHSSHEEWCEYFFKTGGFPLALRERIEKRSIRQAISTYQKWLTGDVLKLGKNEHYMKEVMGRIATVMTTPVGLQSMASKTQLGSHHTLQSYIEILESCFAAKTLYSVDPNEGTPRFKKEKKYYFTDPLIYWMAKSFLELDDDAEKFWPKDFEKMAEMVAHEELSRQFKRFGFLNTPKGEVDFYKHKTWAYEIKWSLTTINLSDAYKKLVVPKKVVWNKHNLLER